MKVVGSEHKERMNYVQLPAHSFRRLGALILIACHGVGHAVLMLFSSAGFIPTIWKPRVRREVAAHLFITRIKVSM